MIVLYNSATTVDYHFKWCLSTIYDGVSGDTGFNRVFDTTPSPASN